MNQFEAHEESAAHQVFLASLALTETYAQECDREAATIALLLRALEIAGDRDFLKENEDESTQQLYTRTAFGASN